MGIDMYEMDIKLWMSAILYVINTCIWHWANVAPIVSIEYGEECYVILKKTPGTLKNE